MGKDRLTFGLLIDWPDNNSKYQSSLINGISSFAEKFDINLILLGVGRLGSESPHEKPRETLYDFLKNKSLFSGFILFSSSLSSLSGTDMLAEKISGMTDLPVVSIAIDLPGMYSVIIDNKPGFAELVEHLIVHHRYRDIAYISGPRQNAEAIERLQIVQSLFSRHNIHLPESHLYFGNFTMGSGIQAVNCFLDERKIRPRAIIAANDNMAMGAWDVLQKKQISVPGEIAVTGFDDLQISPVFDLPFTTVKQPLFCQGYDVAEKLYKIIMGEQIERVSCLKSQVVYRNSCGCIPNAVSPGDSKSTNSPDPKELFFNAQRKKFKQAVARKAKGSEGDPIIRCWNRIVLTGIESNIRQSELFAFIRMLQEEYSKSGTDSKEKQLVNSITDKLKIMTSDFYLSSDLLERAHEENMNKASITLLEAIGGDRQNADSLQKQIETIREVLPSTNINICTVSLFDSCIYDKDGHSNLMFWYENGTVRKPENPVFRTIDLLHPEFRIEGRYEILIELLYQEENKFGILVLDMRATGINIFEIIRTRLSRMIEAYFSRQNLMELNRQLTNEITIRHETEKKLQEALATLKDLSLSDELTGLYNRRGFMTLGEQQIRYCRREREPFTIFYADMDGLKKINDKYGHTEGDRAIRLIAEVLRDSFRETDIIARLGGDEFTVLAIKTGEDTITRMYERINKNIKSMNGRANVPYSLSISIGTFNSSGQPDITLEEMLNTADRDLYKDKRQKKTGQ
ncbi:MAG: GGDEF domain-containing protein [Spirochaetales bacterium]|nr:GGDEF domain-containing protein [Spirochaetales bacterium]